mmetsp:Transcript_21415/g.25999  ORF Transcript_21415/g.25999 Transcript_21415/m.25999 type:complete len:315 (+) Transcript_21415:111-1055(+)
MRSKYGTSRFQNDNSSYAEEWKRLYGTVINKSIVKTNAFLERHKYETRFKAEIYSNTQRESKYQRQISKSFGKLNFDSEQRSGYPTRLEAQRKRALRLSRELVEVDVRPTLVKQRKCIAVDTLIDEETKSTDTCDKCDGSDHETDYCPVYKKARDKHPDAQRRKLRNIGGGGGNKVVHNARIARMPGDGDCLFHSLAYGLGRSSTARNLRREIAAFIAKNPSLEIAETPLRDWIRWDSNNSVSMYAKRMSIRGWGGGIECAAFSHLKGINVHIYEKQRRSSGYKRISCFDVGTNKRTINVVYCGGVHYNALEIK